MKTLNTVGHQPDFEAILSLVSEGYIRQVTHPEDPTLHLFNYTPQCQYEQHWTMDTLICRGLIARCVDDVWTVVARPFPKFFNWQELAHLREDTTPMKGPWEVLEKYDGSMAIAYQFKPGDWRIATRGSFISDQALWATQHIKEKDYFKTWSNGLTYVMEIIYPENRIVVDYSGREELVLLDILSTSTGARVTEVDTCDLPEWGMTHGIQDTIPQDQRENKEGYVLVNEQGFRVKVKHDEYVRLHKIMTETTARTVWEHMSNPELDFNELLDNVPDEFYEWVRDVQDRLKEEYREIAAYAHSDYNDRPFPELEFSRKEMAEYFKTCDHPAILFAMLDNKDYSGLIWKLIRPGHELPFNQQEDT